MTNREVFLPLSNFDFYPRAWEFNFETSSCLTGDEHSYVLGNYLIKNWNKYWYQMAPLLIASVLVKGSSGHDKFDDLIVLCWNQSNFPSCFLVQNCTFLSYLAGCNWIIASYLYTIPTKEGLNYLSLKVVISTSDRWLHQA